MDAAAPQSSPETPVPPGRRSDEERRRGLKRMRMLATALLVVMAALYVAARWGEAAWPWLVYVRAFAEAAMVGALADWFAVAALFRHPLGLPIPHTAIIPRNQDRIGDSLGNFVTNNFLVPQVVLPKLVQADAAARLGAWLGDRRNARLVAVKLVAIIPPVLNAGRDERVRLLLATTLAGRLRRIEAAPLLGRVLGVAVARRQHQQIFDRLLDLAADFVIDNHQTIRRKVSAKSGKWVPSWVDDKLTNKILSGLEETLSEARAPDHPWREAFNQAAERFIHDLGHSTQYIAMGEALKEEVLNHPAVQSYFDSVWTEIKTALLEDAGREDGRMVGAVERAVHGFGRQLQKDADMRAVINGWVERFVVTQVVPRRDAIGTFISGVVKRWDTRTVVAKLELQVGRDLQYIRINGTLVGGLVGLAIHILTELITGGP